MPGPQGVSREVAHQVQHMLEEILRPMGYVPIAVELIQSRDSRLRVFIDKLIRESAIGIEDCVAVTKALDAPLDQSALINSLFPSGYELEVSSPGTDRPLFRPEDFQAFVGTRARIHTERPLTSEELANADYAAANPRQRNFLGTLQGLAPEISPTSDVVLEIPVSAKKTETVHIPLALVTKAHLDPELELKSRERKKSS